MSDKPGGDARVDLSNLKWPLDDSVPAVYANQFAIAEFGSEIALVFGEFLPTGLFNRSKDEIEEYLRDAAVKQVAKIVVTPAGLEAFFGLLKGYMDKKQATE